MPNLIVRFQDAAAPRWGALTSTAPGRPEDIIEVVPIATDATTTAGLIAAIDADPALPTREEPVRIAAATLLSPVTSDATLVCQGLNYREHAAEAGHHERKANLFFAKASSSLTGPYADIVRPAGVELLDYEIEVGIVLRRAIKAGEVVTSETIGSYVAGAVLCNDISARDIMFGASFMQWYQGKSYRGFCPTGPVLYLFDAADAAAALRQLEIKLTYEGKVRQSASTADLIYGPAETLTQLGQIMDLKPGDMVLTGTPGGVVVQGTPKLIESLKTFLLDDIRRRDEMRFEMKRLANFLQPGEVLSLRMRDAGADSDLGGQYSRIISA
ncbi:MULTISPECIES: fumarylacetoacetate hydrolase family protein [Sphingobium]|uniref:fumarylacetoacetate hydrolase family protein n=1 Tax=Sphingobium TaxID=165695 RepID=UPI00159C3456|nr:fumarylacetoacetate hydrolase family protein [Sphingobium sp. 15-1]